MKDKFNSIIQYLKFKYNPMSIIVYGSYSDDTYDENSDFDCLLIVKSKDLNYDNSIIDGVMLDCHIYTVLEIESMNSDDFLMVYSAVIIEDDGEGEKLINRVRQYVKDNSKTDECEKIFICSWIIKNLKRAEKSDDDGLFRMINIMTDSLGYYFILRDKFYLGSKKALRYLLLNDIKGYALYHNALNNLTFNNVKNWAEYVITPVNNKR